MLLYQKYTLEKYTGVDTAATIRPRKNQPTTNFHRQWLEYGPVLQVAEARSKAFGLDSRTTALIFTNKLITWVLVRSLLTSSYEIQGS